METQYFGNLISVIETIYNSKSGKTVSKELDEHSEH